MEHLEPGGVFLGYVDLENNIEWLINQTEGVLNIVGQAVPEASPFLKMDWSAILEPLGFYNLRALGASSVLKDNAYHNRMFVYMPDGRTGLMLFYGDTNQKFSVLDLADYEADIIFENSLNLEALYDAVLQIAQSVSGEMGKGLIQAALMKNMGPLPVTYLELVKKGEIRTNFIVRLNHNEKIQIPNEPITIPQFEFVIGLEEMGWFMDRLAILTEGDTAMFEFITDDQHTILRPLAPIPEQYNFLQPAVVRDHETDALYLVSSLKYYEELNSGKTSIRDNPDFQKAWNGLPESGNWAMYMSNELSQTYIDLYVEAFSKDPQTAPMAEMFEQMGQQFTSSTGSTSTKMPNGTLVLSNAPYSYRLTLANAAIMPVGLLAAMAIPAFNKVRATSQEKAITNNLRQYASAAQQHMLDTGDYTVSYEEIVGPGNYIHTLEEVAGESYEDITLGTDTTRISTTTKDGREIHYDF